ncbi:hypothetical protein Efla_000488 [Eimeria flavescens]
MGLFDGFLKKIGVKKGAHPQKETAATEAATHAAPAPAATPATTSAPAAAPAAPITLAAPAGSPAAAAPAAAPAAVTRGGYLTFDGASNGTLFIVWSVSPVEGALAFFEPKKTVPDFKFKDNGGKSEIIRNLMEDKSKYYNGWCQFFKTAAECHGVCRLLPGAESAPLKVEVAFLDGSRVLRLHPGSELSARNMTAVGCIPKGDNAFEVQTLAKDVFLRQARKGGAAITL